MILNYTERMNLVVPNDT